MGTVENSIDSKDSIVGLKGGANIVVGDINGKVARTQHCNTITNAGRMSMLAHSAGKMLGAAASYQNQLVSLDMMNISRYSGGRVGEYHNMNSEMCCVLLNLGDEADELSASNPFVKVLNSDMTINTDKVVGFCRSNVESTGTEGVAGFTDYVPENNFLVNGNITSKKFYWEAGRVVGQFDTIAMMPYSALVCTGECAGVRVVKGLDRVNCQKAGAVLADKIIPPGYPGFTSNSEVLLKYNAGTGSLYHKYNMTTGEMTDVEQADLPSEDYAYCTIRDMITINSYTYVLCGDTSSLKMFVVNSSGVVVTTCSNIDYNTLGLGCGRLLYDGTNLYITSRKTFVCTLHSNGYYYNPSEVTRPWTLPTSVPTNSDGYRTVYIGNYDTKYVMYVGKNFDAVMTGYVFTSLSDIGGTLTGEVIPCVYPYTYVKNIGGVCYTIDKGLPVGSDGLCMNGIFSNGGNGGDGRLDTISKTIINSSNNNLDNLTCSPNKKGAFLSRGWWGNVVSFIKLPSPVSMTAVNYLNVTYGYQIVLGV